MNKKESKSVIYYPIFLNLRGKRCVVIGGGNVALRKVKVLLDCGANVTMICPKPHPEIVKLSKKRAIHFIQRDYEKGDLRDAAIAFACTDVKKVNRKVAVDAKEVGVLVNVADDPRPSDFIIPSFFRKGNLTVAISTAGVSPALAKKIRMKLEKSFGKEYGPLLSIIGEIRSAIKKRGIILEPEIWQEALNLDSLIHLLQAGQREKVKTYLMGKLKVHQLGK
jgi:precorrin-2 dehydrogenase/sirohydrochlorin ferrochelatase